MRVAQSRLDMRTLAVAVVFATGCTGVLLTGDPPAPGEDAGPPIVIMPDDDAGATSDGGPPITPGTDAGPAPIDAGPIDPCAGVTCGANARCEAGACRCDEGFVDQGGSCIALPAGDPATRTDAAVCDAWRDGHVENASPPWIEGATTCDPGSMPAAAIDDTMRRVNMFRWLLGLPPAAYDGSTHQAMMECAHMMSVNGALNHEPPSTWQCYTAEGGAAAGRSNLALGVGSAAQAIDLYMSDWNTPSLGHRRWVISPGLDVVEIGFAGRGQCLGVFHFGATTDRAWTAYPNQGPAPIDTAQDVWSFHANSISISESTTVTVTEGGAPRAVTSYFIGGGWGPPSTLAWSPSGWTPTAGATYRVTISGTSIGDVTYEVRLVGC